jgi:hypothetical protein
MKRARKRKPPYTMQSEDIENPLVTCYECHTIWHSTEHERCPLCKRQIGDHWVATEEQTRQLMDTVSLIDEERMERGSEYESWAFHDNLRKNMPFYNVNCRRTLQLCYEVLRAQPLNPKIAFAIEIVKEDYLYAPDDLYEEYHSWTDEEEYHHWTDED